MIIDRVGSASPQPSKPKLSLLDLPWDVMSVIVDFLPLNDQIDKMQKVYHNIRLINRDFHRLVSMRRKSLAFKNKDITERAFFNLISKATGEYLSTTLKGRTPLVDHSTRLVKFGMLGNLQSIGVGSFNKLLPSVRGLQFLEL